MNLVSNHIRKNLAVNTNQKAPLNVKFYIALQIVADKYTKICNKIQ